MSGPRGSDLRVFPLRIFVLESDLHHEDRKHWMFESVPSFQVVNVFAHSDIKANSFGEKASAANNNDDVVLHMEELPPIVMEGKDFRNELPYRLYLDSDPEFHLNMHLVISYLMLFQVDSHFVTVGSFIEKATADCLPMRALVLS